MERSFREASQAAATSDGWWELFQSLEVMKRWERGRRERDIARAMEGSVP